MIADEKNSEMIQDLEKDDFAAYFLQHEIIFSKKLNLEQLWKLACDSDPSKRFEAGKAAIFWDKSKKRTVVSTTITTTEPSQKITKQ